MKPHVRLWNSGAKSGPARASGHVEIEGFVPNSVLRVAGYKIKSPETLQVDDEKLKSLDLLEPSPVQFLRKTFPQTHVTVSPATILRG